METKIFHPNSAEILNKNDPQRLPSNKSQFFVSRQTIKRFWSKLEEGCMILCRAIGLNILVSSFKLFRHPWGKGFAEKKKVAIQKRRPTALLRALVHLIPVGVALWEVTLNWNTYYVGSFLLKQVYYQTMAKVHEIMIQASLAAILFSYIRHEMVLGKGIPFGALFSGLQINQISYLWSMEFWGSMSSNSLSVWRKMVTLVFISFCFILAAVAGPSSAILLIPRLCNWPAGSTHIWVNATSHDLWPSCMNGSSVPRHCAVLEAGSPSNECPASEWNFIQNWLLLVDHSLPDGIRSQSPSFGRHSRLPTSIQLTGKTSTRQYKSVNIDYSEKNSSYFARTTASTTQQAGVADALTSIGALWDITIKSDTQVGVRHGASFFDEQKAVHNIANNYYQPYSSVFCVRDVIQGSNDERFIAFPIKPGFDTDIEPDLLPNINAFISGSPAIEVPSIRRAQFLELPGTESENRVKWVQLPESPLAGVSVGLIVLLPSNPLDLSRQTITTTQNDTDIVVCNIGAGWGASSINMTTTQTISPTSSNVKFDVASIFRNHSRANGVNSFQDLADGLTFAQPMFPSMPVKIDIEWAEYLNPYVPLANATLIDHLLRFDVLNGSKAVNPEFRMQYILTGLMTNGLARSGFTSELQGNIKLTKENETYSVPTTIGDDQANGKVPDANIWLTGKSDFFTVDPEESKDWVKLRVDSTIQGYAYNIEGPAPKVAIGFLLTYCCFAVGHCLYSGISGISSTCWDSISEVTALAINSPPTTMLRNTCAGIAEIRIFKIPVRILTMTDPEGEGEHLELVFGNVDIEDEDPQERAIKPNRKYGTMPAVTNPSLTEKSFKLD